MMLRGASADAMASLTAELETVVSNSPETAARISDDLFGVATTLRSEGALRRFASDVSVQTEAKTGLVTQVFGGKVADGALTLLTSAVSKRWTTSRELADGLESLSVIAAVRSVGNDTARLSDELFELGQAVSQHPELRDALSDPARSIQAKSALIDDLLGSSALPATITLAKQSLAGTHRTVGVALKEYQRITSDVHGERVATVHVARELSAADQTRLADVLSRQYGRPVHLNLLVDPNVLGGIRVEIGDDVIDGTVSSRLDDARRRLVG